jgi:site-specific recombinase XerD
MGLAPVRDLREFRSDPTPEDLEDFEVDLMSEFVLARAAAGVSDSAIRRDIGNLEMLREWLDRPLWSMSVTDADAYFGAELKTARPSTRAAKAATIAVYFDFMDLRHKVRIHELTGHIVECPLDTMNRPRASVDPLIRVPPSEAEITALFAGWRSQLATVRRFAPAARNYTVARLMGDVGLRINEARMLDLADVRWDLGRFGKLHVRFGKGAKRSGPRARMVPLINGSDTVLRWYIEDVWSEFGIDPALPGAPLFPVERLGNGRAGGDTLRVGLANAVALHLPAWAGTLSPHYLRHFAASQLYAAGMDLLAIQELLGHVWTATTLRYVHVQKNHIEDAWIAGQERAAQRWEGLAR